MQKDLGISTETGAILTYIGCPSTFSETAATKGTLFSEPRPTVPAMSDVCKRQVWHWNVLRAPICST